MRNDPPQSHRLQIHPQNTDVISSFDHIKAEIYDADATLSRREIRRLVNESFDVAMKVANGREGMR